MNQTALRRLYLMVVGSMPQYDIPVVCYLLQTVDGRHILIDSGLPEMMPEDETDFVNGQSVIEHLARLGLKPEDIDMVISTHYDLDHAGRHGAFSRAQYVVQRAHHVDAASNPRFAAIRTQWDQPIERIRLVDGDTALLPGLTLVDTDGHVPGHQSVLLHLPETGAILLTADAVPFASDFARSQQDDESASGGTFKLLEMDESTRASTIKLLDLVEQEQVGLVIFGHDTAQWDTLKKAPDYYA